MEIFDYLSKWDEKELSKLTLDKFKGLSVDDSTMHFLMNVGLPESAAPFVSFDRAELNTIEELYSTGVLAHRFLIEIGSDGAGNPICVDLLGNCRIVVLDHETDFEPMFVNSSVKHLFAFLTIYMEFGNKLIHLRGDSAFIDSNFTDEELNDLLIRLRSVDHEALSNEETFWCQEIEIFKSNRGVF